MRTHVVKEFRRIEERRNREPEMISLQLTPEVELPEKDSNEHLAIEIAKFEDPVLQEAADRLSFQVRKHKFTYRQLCDIFERVRKENKLRRPKRERKLPQLLTEDDLKAFFKVISNTEHEIMMRFLLTTAIRVNELVNVKVIHVDIGHCKVRIEQGKGAKDREVLFPVSMQLLLRTYLQLHPNHEYLFESRRFNKYTPRRIQQIMMEYGQQAGLGKRVHPHLFRHVQITDWTRKGMTDAQIQLISGHSSKKSLELYQHIGLQSVEKAYQEAMR
jgi:integrase/recombinase XerD